LYSIDKNSKNDFTNIQTDLYDSKKLNNIKDVECSQFQTTQSNELELNESIENINNKVQIVPFISRINIGYRGLNKDFCGLVHIPNMHDTYGVYYDWGAHFEANGIKNVEDFRNHLSYDFAESFYHFIEGDESEYRWFENNKEVKHYRGMCLENSTDMRGSSVSKGEKPLCHMVYNESGFKDHCKKYKEYKDWEKNRNPKRYESNLNKNYDSKNMYHSIRLIRMGREIAEGKGIILDRREAGDRDFIMDVRHHKFEYDELIDIVTKEEKALNDAIDKSTLPEKIDANLVNDLLIEIRKIYYGML
jgi:hypothetical protein